MNEMNERKSFLSSADKNIEVWDQAGRPMVKPMCFRVENQIFNPALKIKDVILILQINVRSIPQMCCSLVCYSAVIEHKTLKCGMYDLF